MPEFYADRAGVTANARAANGSVRSAPHDSSKGSLVFGIAIHTDVTINLAACNHNYLHLTACIVITRAAPGAYNS